MTEYVQGHSYTVADIWNAFEAGAREARANGGAPSDDLIRKSADAYCKLVHPLAEPLCWDCEDGKLLNPAAPEGDCPTCGRLPSEAV